MIVRCPYCNKFTQHIELPSYAHRYQCGVCKLIRLIRPTERAELLAEVAHRPRAIGRYLA